MTRYVYTLNLCGYNQVAFTTVDKALEYLCCLVKNATMITNIEVVMHDYDEDGSNAKNTTYYDPTDRRLWPIFKAQIAEKSHLQLSYDSEYGNGGVKFLDKVIVQ